jgi:hypothetical protein
MTLGQLRTSVRTLPGSETERKKAVQDELLRRSREGDPAQRVLIADLDMPFGSMVSFMVKWSIAVIPAAIILALIGFVVFAALGGLVKH